MAQHVRRAGADIDIVVLEQDEEGAEERGVGISVQAGREGLEGRQGASAARLGLASALSGQGDGRGRYGNTYLVLMGRSGH